MRVCLATMILRWFSQGARTNSGLLNLWVWYGQTLLELFMPLTALQIVKIRHFEPQEQNTTDASLGFMGIRDV